MDNNLDFIINIQTFINSFFVEVMTSLMDNQVVYVIVRVKYDNNMIRSFSPLTAITNNPNFISYLLKIVRGYVTLNANHYEQYDPQEIIIDYYISDLPLSDNSFETIRQLINNEGITECPPVTDNEILDYNFLPRHMYLDLWSSNITFRGGVRYAHFIHGDLIFNIKVYKDHYICTVNLSSDNTIILKFKDTLEHPRLGLRSFNRIIYKKDDKYNFEWKNFTYVEGNLICKEERDLHMNYFKLPKKFKTINKRNKSKKLTLPNP